MTRLGGRVALVTGGARGQGRTHALALAAAGADVIVLDIASSVATVDYELGNDDGLQETARLVRNLGRRCHAGIADIRDLEQLRVAVDEGASRLGRLDIVVANAGIAGFSAGGTTAVPPETWQAMLDVNLTGTWNTVVAAVPHLRAAGKGSITAICSISGVEAAAGIGHYVASKHGVVGLIKTLAIELGPDSIRANCVLPTEVNTPMLMNPRSMALYVPEKKEPTPTDLARVTRALHVLPVPWVEPEDVSNAVVFLASEDARYITGVALPVDAGALLI
jgi:(+)-trans-carveol dehydrogenase